MNTKNKKKHGEDSYYGIYWMQKAQRVKNNEALEFAIKESNKNKLPLIVVFLHIKNYPEAVNRSYKFMLEGLLEVEQQLIDREIRLVVKTIQNRREIPDILKKAAFIVSEKAYLNFTRKWHRNVRENTCCNWFDIETEVVVPVEKASQKEEYSAYTLRRKIKPKIDTYLKLPQTEILENPSLKMESKLFNGVNLKELLAGYIAQQRLPAISFKGGYSKAKKLIDNFISKKLEFYSEKSNEPSLDFQSNLSPYLHFGQISTKEIALKVKESEYKSEDFLEQLIVRRELAINFVYYNENYTKISCLPDWSQKTLNEHKDDKREYNYSLEELENAKTHDKYWNTAQNEMFLSGKMHGYMRMYWGKKIIEWSNSPEAAWEKMIYLNNKYEIDGRDANGYAGIAWCFGKHDRAWKEREIFGKIRYMNARGLERKFNMKDYLAKVNRMKEE